MDANWRERLVRQQAAADRLREEVEARRKLYVLADAEYKRLSSLAKELGLDHPDGATAAKHAAQQFHQALEAYSQAVKRFSDLILRGAINCERLPDTGGAEEP